jgi:hypothetical protein
MRFSKPATSIPDQIALLRKRGIALIDGCALADPRAMGFPDGWRERPAWRGTA